jgi:site-specific DNA-methyltransferase (adenine-specific)
MRVQVKIITSAKHFTARQTMALKKTGGGYRVWCNPPYSKISEWVEKAYRETRKDNTLVVMLLPSRTDTRYFHNYIYQRSEIRFIKGRLRFNESKNTAPFPSMIVIFRGANLKGEK